MLTRLRLRHIRCFDAVALDLDPSGFTVFTGANAQGKTTLLEAIAVLLRLQSPRTTSLAELVRIGHTTASIDGDFAGRRLRMLLGDARRMEVDGQEYGRARDYLAESGLLVWMGNDDIQLVRGSADGRRRFLDFAASQRVPGYLESLRAYERALRARNFLLKAVQPDRRQLDAYTKLIVRHGEVVSDGRRLLVAELAPHAAAAQCEISGHAEPLQTIYRGCEPGGLADELESKAAEEARRKVTLAGPHRDDLELLLHGRSAGSYASEGQQRTIALALKVAQARVLGSARGIRPILLLDDIFGELDPGRRHRLFASLPEASQKFATTTTLGWMGEMRASLRVLNVADGIVHPAHTAASAG